MTAPPANDYSRQPSRLPLHLRQQLLEIREGAKRVEVGVLRHAGGVLAARSASYTFRTLDFDDRQTYYFLAKSGRIRLLSSLFSLSCQTFRSMRTIEIKGAECVASKGEQ